MKRRIALALLLLGCEAASIPDAGGDASSDSDGDGIPDDLDSDDNGVPDADEHDGDPTETARPTGSIPTTTATSCPTWPSSPSRARSRTATETASWACATPTATATRSATATSPSTSSATASPTSISSTRTPTAGSTPTRRATRTSAPRRSTPTETRSPTCGTSTATTTASKTRRSAPSAAPAALATPTATACPTWSRSPCPSFDPSCAGDVTDASRSPSGRVDHSIVVARGAAPDPEWVTFVFTLDAPARELRPAYADGARDSVDTEALFVDQVTLRPGPFGCEAFGAPDAFRDVPAGATVCVELVARGSASVEPEPDVSQIFLGFVRLVGPSGENVAYRGVVFRVPPAGF